MPGTRDDCNVRTVRKNCLVDWRILKNETQAMEMGIKSLRKSHSHLWSVCHSSLFCLPLALSVINTMRISNTLSPLALFTFILIIVVVCSFRIQRPSVNNSLISERKKEEVGYFWRNKGSKCIVMLKFPSLDHSINLFDVLDPNDKTNNIQHAEYKDSLNSKHETNVDANDERCLSTR